MTAGHLKTVTTINGLAVPASEAKISVFDNALLYAEGLFETFLAIDDRVIFLDEHLDRLFKGADVIDLELPVSRATLTEWMINTVKAHPDRITKLRLTITSGEAARWVGVPGKPQVILSASPHVMPTEPFRLLVSDYRIDQTSVFRRIKTISYAIHAAALKRAKQLQFDDALMLNGNDEIAEITSANIFWVKDDNVFTPPISAGCLEGVTRKITLDVAKGLDINITERDENLAGLLDADEIFISSSLKLIVGVSCIADGANRYEFVPGAITRQLSERFKELVRL